MLLQRVQAYFKSLVIDSKKYIRFAIILAVICTVIGAVVFLVEPKVIDYIMSIFKEKFGTDRPLDWHMVMEIFKNNLITCGIALGGGLLFGLAPFFVLGFNFFAIGIVSAFFLTAIPANLGQKIILLLAALFPHGILELPVILLSCALGFRLGLRWLMEENKSHRISVLKEDLGIALKAAPALAIILFIAAVVEVYGTGRLLEWLTPQIMGI